MIRTFKPWLACFPFSRLAESTTIAMNDANNLSDEAKHLLAEVVAWDKNGRVAINDPRRAYPNYPGPGAVRRVVLLVCSTNVGPAGVTARASVHGPPR